MSIETQSLLQNADHKGKFSLQQMENEEKLICNFIINFEKIQRSSSSYYENKFYKIMGDMLEFFSIDFLLIKDVVNNCFGVENEEDVNCLLNAHYRYRTEKCALFLILHPYIRLPLLCLEN